MADKLQIYNLALGHLRERRLATLAENREPRRVLDDFWDHVVELCLQEEGWKFATRAVAIDKSTTVTPSFGYANAFRQPDDMVMSLLVSAQETFNPPLLLYRDEGGYWYADVDPLYVRYVSTSNLYGQNFGTWKAKFVAYAALELAEQACGRITGNTSLLDGEDGIVARKKKARRVAKGFNAMLDPPGFAPAGSWVRSRRSGGGGDRAPSSGNLTD